MKTRMAALFAGALLVVLSGTASAHGRLSVGIAIGAPGYAYVAPPPVYYAPAPVYYAPPPVYYAPAPWVVVRPYRYWDRGWDRRHRHWDRRYW